MEPVPRGSDTVAEEVTLVPQDLCDGKRNREKLVRWRRILSDRAVAQHDMEFSVWTCSETQCEIHPAVAENEALGLYNRTGYRAFRDIANVHA
jgi:hypothetical protein